MENFLCCTITGADMNVPQRHLISLWEKYRFVEWGILFSPTGQGTKRYPTYDWAWQLASTPAELPLAAHLCGGALNHIAEQDQEFCSKLYFQFNRAQLNFNAQSKKTRAMLQDLAFGAHKFGLNIITQDNDANKDVSHIFRPHGTRHTFVYDASGGKGVSPEGWPAPDKSKAAYGYAGGLGPDNIAEELPKIFEAADGHFFWIDMETGVRDENDEFDLDRVEHVLKTVQEFL